MEVKEAVKVAKDYVADILKEEGVVNLGLEEIEFGEGDNTWHVTLGFSRPWNTVRNALTAMTGENAPRRVYRVVKIKDDDGRVISLTKRDAIE